jgi:hypothetical protein
MNTIRKLAYLLIFFLFIGSVATVKATTESLSIEARRELIYKINLSSEDHVQLTFLTTGQSSSNLSSSIVFPNSTVISLGEVDRYSTRFTTGSKGTCELHFDNTNSTEAAFVALNYEIEHYILGIPQMIFFLVAIAVLLMVVVTGYIITGKHT